MKKQKTISFRLPEDLYNRLDQAAKTLGANKSTLIVMLLQNTLDRTDRQIEKAFTWAGINPITIDEQNLVHYTARFSKFLAMVDEGHMEEKDAEAHIRLEGEMYRESMKSR